MVDDRYSRQELLSEIGSAGQKKIAKSVVAIVGVGGLGTFCAEQLARAGVGKLILIDGDVVELNNLQRQILFSESDVGSQKAAAAKKHIEKINNEVKLQAHSLELNQRNLEIIEDADIILDCTDNLKTRFVINEFCVVKKKTWVYASVAGAKGFVKAFYPGKECFKCIFKESGNCVGGKGDDCETVGVVNFAVSIVSAIQVGLAIKIILGKQVDGSLLKIDAWENNIEHIKTKKNVNCVVCKNKY